MKWGAFLSLITAAVIAVISFSSEHISAFENNNGSGMLQFKAGKHILAFAPTKAYIASIDHALTIEFLGTKGVMPQAEGETAAKTSSRETPSLRKVVYRDLWEGISLTYEATKDGLTESIYHVTPGADVSRIRLKYNVPVELQKNGTLRLKFKSGYLTESAPVAWQEKDGKLIPVTVAFQLAEGAVGFKVGEYDKTRPLVIDPTYQWHTFYGSMLSDTASSIAVDGNGNVYVAGYSMSGWQGDGNANPLHPFPGLTGPSTFVLKLNSAGQYQWHTFYGPDHTTVEAFGMAVDANGNVYVTGVSEGSWQGDNNKDPLHSFSGGINGYDIFVLKLNNSGQYQWHTFYGGYYDIGNAIAADGDFIYISGCSDQSWQGDNGEAPKHPHSGSGNRDIFVLKLSGSGQYLWHTYYGSPAERNVGQGIITFAGGVYVTGYSQGFLGDNDSPPLHSAAHAVDFVFVLKLTSSGQYVWHTFYGDGTASLSNETYGTGITADGSGGLYITGNTYSSWQGPGTQVPQHLFTGGAYNYDYDMFVLKLDSGGSYHWHTFYPGAADSYYGLAGYAITSDAAGNTFVTGGSRTSWLGDGNTNPLNPYNSMNDAVVVALDASGQYQWHTFYGSGSDDWGNGIALDGSGSVYVAGNSGDGWTADNSVAPLHPFNYNWGIADTFILKIAAKTPTVTTADVTAITTTAASGGGAVTSTGGLSLSARGVCWSINSNPTLSDTCTNDGTGTGSYASSITGLTQNMTYHVRAYGTNAAGTGYGNDVQFTTGAIPNKVNLVMAISGTGAGTITGTPGIACSAHTCIMTFDSGTAISVTAAAADGSVFKWFSTTGSATSCNPSSNSCQFSIMTNTSITASFFALPTVITMPVTSIASRTATSGGFVTSGGGYSVNFRGVCWSKTPNPVRTDTCTTDGNGAGRYYSYLTLLSPNTTYHVRAYAQTAYATGYGADLQFTTAPAASMAYVSNLSKNGVEMIDTGSNSSIGWLATGSAPYGVAVNPYETRVYVANSGINKVSVIDAATNTVLTSVTVGQSPMGVASNMTDTRVYTANNIGGTVSVIDTSTYTVIATIPVGNGPNGIAVSPDGSRVYVANTTENSVSVIDSGTNAVIDTITLSSGSGPFGVAVSPDGNRVYTSNSQGNSVSVINATTRAVVGAPIAVGSSPYGIAVNPDGSRVFVVNKNNSNVSIIDTATNTVTGSPIGVGGSPRGIAFTPDGARAYVANYQTNSISVIDTASNTVTATINVWNNPIGFGQFIRPSPSCSIKLVKSAGFYYLTIHEAYSAVTTDGQIMQMQTTDFSEPDLNLNKSFPVVLRGGYGCDFTTSSGYTTVHSILTISGGAVTVENVIIN